MNNHLNKYLKIALITAVPIIILVIVLLVLPKHLTKEPFSLAKYTVVNVSGLNGRATATVSVDEIGLYAVLAGSEATEAEKKVYADFVNSVQVKLSRTENLSNEDVLTVTVTYSEKQAEKLGIVVDITERTHTVSGLTVGTELELFADVKIVTSGISPFISAYYENNSANPYISTLKYTLSKSENLTIGDTIEIVCSADADSAAALGYYFEQTTMEYTITKADYYLSNARELPIETLQELLTDDIAAITAATADTTNHMSYLVTNKEDYLFRDNNEEAVNFAYYGTIVANNSTTTKLEHQNYVLVFLKGQIRMPNYQAVADPYDYIDAYFCFIYNDAIFTIEDVFTMATNDALERFACGDSFEDCFQEVRGRIGAGYRYGELVDQISEAKAE